MKLIYFFILKSFLILPLQANEKERSISTRTAVIFNTLCAKCHEGECSGRLTFHNNYKQATSHIQRYAGDLKLSDEEVKDFFALLNHMKKKCSILMPHNEILKHNNFSKFALLSSKGYFIPLGKLQIGKYNLSFKSKEHLSFRIEVISSQLDYYIDEYFCPQTKGYTLSFIVNKETNNFIRIISQKPLHLISLELKKDK